MDRADTQHQHPAPGEVGRLLAEAREALGLAVADVAARLRLAPRQIEALEADDYERLPGRTFTRGFVRNYARLLQMDPAPLLAALDQSLPESRVSEIVPRTEDIPFSTGKPDSWRRYLLLLVLLLLVVPLVLFETYRDRLTPEPPPAPVTVAPLDPPAPPAAPASVPSAAETSPAAPAEPPLAVPAAQAPASAGRPPGEPVAPAVEAQQPAASPPAAAAEPSPAVGRSTLRFRFSRESWVEVRNAAGEVVASRLNAPDSEWTVSGRLPLALVVGNAEGVTLEMDGKPVALSPRPGSGVARLTLE